MVPLETDNCLTVNMDRNRKVDPVTKIYRVELGCGGPKVPQLLYSATDAVLKANAEEQEDQHHYFQSVLA